MNDQFDIKHDELGSPDIEIFRQVDMSKLGTPDFFIPPHVSSKLSEKYLKVIDEKHKSLLKENGYVINNNANNVGNPQNVNNFKEQQAQYEQLKAQVAQIESFLKSLQPQQLAGMNRLYDLFSVLPPEEKKIKFQSMQSGQQQIITMVGKVREFHKNKEKIAAKIQQQQNMGTPVSNIALDTRLKHSPYQNSSPTQYNNRMMNGPPSSGRSHGSTQFSPMSHGPVGNQTPLAHQHGIQQVQNEIHLPNPVNEHMFSNEERIEILKKVPKMPELPKFEVVYVDPPKTYKKDLFEHSKMVSEQRPELKNKIPIELIMYERMIYKDKMFMKNAGIYKDGETPKGDEDRLSEFGFSERENDLRVQKELAYLTELKKKTSTQPINKNVDMIKQSFLDSHLGYYQLKENINKNKAIKKMLIPIRLEFDVENHGFDLRDTFLINGNDNFNKVKIFVEDLVKDYDFFEDGINDHYVHELITDKILLQILTYQKPELFKSKDGEKRELKITIKLNILNKNVVFKDVFEWDILNPLNDAGEFAEALGEELELDPELIKNIEFGILEQEQSYLKMLMLQGGKSQLKGEVTNELLQNLFIPNALLYEEPGAKLDIFRNLVDTKTFSPSLVTLTNHGLDDLKMEDYVKQEDSIEFLNLFFKNNSYIGDINIKGDSSAVMQKINSDDSSAQVENDSTNTSRMDSVSIGQQNLLEMKNSETDLKELGSEKDNSVKYSSRRTDKKINYFEGSKHDDIDEDLEDMSIVQDANTMQKDKDFIKNKILNQKMLEYGQKFNQSLAKEDELLRNKKLESLQELVNLIKKSDGFVTMTFDDIPKVMSDYNMSEEKSIINKLFDNLSYKDIGELYKAEVTKGNLMNVLEGKLINNTRYYSKRFLTGETKDKKDYDINKYKIRKSIKYQPQKCFIEEKILAEEGSKLLMKVKVNKIKSINYLKSLNI